MAGFSVAGRSNSGWAGRVAATGLPDNALPTAIIAGGPRLWRFGATGLPLVLVGNVGRAAQCRSPSVTCSERGRAQRSKVTLKTRLSASSVYDRKQGRDQKPWSRGGRLCAAATWLEVVPCGAPSAARVMALKRRKETLTLDVQIQPIVRQSANARPAEPGCHCAIATESVAASWPRIACSACENVKNAVRCRRRRGTSYPRPGWAPATRSPANLGQRFRRLVVFSQACL